MTTLRTYLAEQKWSPFWSVLGSTLVLALIVGFFLHGGLHGLYSDDYSQKAWAYDFSAARWRLRLDPIIPRFRPLHSILTPNLVNALPEHEFPARLGIVVVHSANVFLLAVLAYRLTGSLLTAVLGGAYLLIPVFANEALLWFTNAIPATISLFFLLIGFHLVLTCHVVRRDLLLLAGGVISWTIMTLFYESGLFTLLLLPVFIGMRRHRGERVNNAAWILALIASYLPLGIYLFFVQRTSWQIAVRGGPTFDLVFILSQRVPDVIRQLLWLCIDWGISGPLREAFELGRREWLSATWGWIILVALLVGLSLVPITYPANQETAPSGRQAFTLGFAGLAWMALALVPILLLKSQIVETRTLYVPMAGIALGLAAIFGWMPALLGRWHRLGIWAVLLVTGATVFAGSLAMAGLVRTYQLRWELDQRQLAAFRAAIPALPSSSPVWLLPVALDERSVTAHLGREALLDRYLFGVCELTWSCSDAIRMEYGDRDIRTVASHRWDRLHMTSVQRSGAGRVSTVTVQERVIPIDHLLAFTYRQGKVIVLNPLVLSSTDASSPMVVDLPLVHEVRSPGLDVQPGSFKLEHP